MIKTWFAALVFALFAAPAWAMTCPALMAEIDRALEDEALVAQVEASDLERVHALRQEGEAYHADGAHTQSEAALNEAKEILGI